MTTFIQYRGAIVAVATARRVVFTGPLAESHPNDPVRRFATGMAAYARELEAGALEGPYDQEDAELYARSLLIDDEEFLARAGVGDELLAEYFGVPVEQVSLKRAELANG